MKQIQTTRQSKEGGGGGGETIDANKFNVVDENSIRRHG